MSDTTADRIYRYIAEHPGAKAIEIARALGLRKRAVNSILYGSLSQRVQRDASYRWHPAVRNAPRLSEPPVPPPPNPVGPLPPGPPMEGRDSPPEQRLMADQDAEGVEASAPLAEDSRERVETVRRAVDRWVTQLMDMTGRNQLLYYRTLKRGTLELTHAEPAGLDTLLAGRSVRLANLLPATQEEPDRFDDALARARTVHKKAVTYFEEKGIDTLYLALGMATWTTDASKATPAAPVLLRPLRFEPRGAAGTDFNLRSEGDWEINEALIQILESEFGVAINAIALLATLDEKAVIDAQGTYLVFERLTKEAKDVPSFDILNRVVVGTFAYTKLPMVRDLQESVEQLAAHDIIAAIAGVEEARDALRELRRKDVDPALPNFTPPGDEYLILDADASQNLAINAALGGEPLIVQGPPGTGKSQTIANLIASLTARGRKVLFVAEKRAAIDAVVKRLAAVGLEDLVLDLHGGVTSKRQLAERLASTLERIGRVPIVQLDDLHRSVERSRGALVAHEQALHARRDPWGTSMLEVNQRLLALPDLPPVGLRFVRSDLQDLDAETAETARQYLAEWARLAEPLVTGRSAWVGAAVTSDGEAEQALDVAAKLAQHLIPATRARLDEILGQTGLRRPSSVEEWRRVLSLLAAVAATLERVGNDIYRLDLGELGSNLSPASRAWPRRGWSQLFSRRYRAAKKQVRDLWLADKKPSSRTLDEVAAAARQQVEEWSALGGTGEPHPTDVLPDAISRYEDLCEQLAALGAFFVTREFASGPIEATGSTVAELVSDRQTLFRLPRIAELRSWLADHHILPLVELIERGEAAPGQAADLFEQAWLASIRDHVMASDPALANFDAQLHDERAAEFRQADRQHRDSTAARVRRSVAERAVSTRDEHQSQDTLVSAQAKRRRGHMPLRRLFEQAPDVLTALRPCWVMSPLVVAQTLPARPVFDVVIFDEASQVPPADAVSALLRAPQAVVAGDREQLPPTTFFDAALDDDTEDDDDASLVVGFQSVLDVLDTLLRSYMLTWHYRSADERLISFSNYNIYDGGLTTFPGAFGDECLQFEPIEHRAGVQADTRSNDAEVNRVVDLTVHHARTRPDESLGVIAMGQYHADRIEALLRKRIATEADGELDAFFDESREERAFVKNLERVQGDERDAIILSVGYGKQPDGRLLYRFGPINMDGGYRRLNVAVTRAKRRLTLASSFSHTDMDPSRSRRRGVELLRSYLKYVSSGGVDLDGARVEVQLNPFEIDVKRRLEAAGMTVIPQYGTSGYRIDFAVPHPDRTGEWALAIEADGASYHSSPTARDRDRLRQEVLERIGWRFHRIWSTAWFNDPAAEVARAVAAFERAINEIPNSGEREEGEPRVLASNRPPARAGRRPNLPKGGSIVDYSTSQLVGLVRWIQSDGLLRTEDELVSELIVELGFKRRGARIVAALRDAIRKA